VTTVGDVVGWLSERYPPEWAEEWDRVGLVLGEPTATVRRVLLAVDCVPETVEQAIASGADMLVTHHPLLLRGVSSVAPVTYKGRIVHRMIKAGVALYCAHTNADVASPGVSDTLAARLGLVDLRPLRPAGGAAAGGGRGAGRIGRLPVPLALADLVRLAAAALPATAWGVRAAGTADLMISTVAVCGGAGDTYLGDATAAGADAFLTADLRHHPASEHIAGGGPALLDAGHWATERPWLDDLAAALRDAFEAGSAPTRARPFGARSRLEVTVSDLVTDAWTLHSPSQTVRTAHPGRSAQSAAETTRATGPVRAAETVRAKEPRS
jgi:dinuclear metal center YbgI/SA1388 family protein